MAKRTTGQAGGSASDRDLIARVAERDESASTELFRRYADEIYGYLLRRARKTEAEDLLQEIFVRALRGASRFRGESSARTWLYSIARNTLSERERERWEAHLAGYVGDPQPGPESLAIGGQQRRNLIAALDRLPDEQALVLELHRVDGFSHKQIAALLGIEIATSRKRMQRAKESLERALATSHSQHGRHSRIESWRSSLLRRALPEEAQIHVQHERRAV